MRRRLRSAAFPLHRHSLPQLAVDGALVALAYYLAFRLRFEQRPARGYYAQLRERTIWWVLAGSLPVLVLCARLPAPLALRRPARLRGDRAGGGRDRAADGRRRRGRRARSTRTTATARSPSALPTGVIVLFALLALVFLVGVRALARSVYERRPLAASAAGARASAAC